MKKGLSIFLALALGAGLLSGCSGGTGGSSAAADTGDGSTGGLISSDGTATLTFATAENNDPNNSYTKILPVWEELEKRTGVKVTFEVADQNQYDEVMGTRLAAGVGLPDIVRVPGGNPLVYANTGLLIPLSALIDEHAPNIKDLYDNKRPDVKSVLTAPDGEIYVIDSIVDARSEVNQMGIGVRKDWLAKLGLDEPSNMEDWYQMLKAFKTGDPNGNGKEDEIPLICMPTPNAKTGGYTYGIYKFGTAYGLHLSVSDGWYADEDGKVAYEWIDPAMKDYLAEMHRWHSEGLLDVEFSTQTSDQWTAKAIGDIAGGDVSSMTMQYPQWNTRMQEMIPDARWESVLPAAAVDGTRYLERENPTEGIYYGITRDCKDPVMAIKWLDYMYASPEGQILLTNFGVEGLSYDMVDGKPQLKESILKDERGSGLAMEALGMNGRFPRVLMKEMIEQRFFQYTDEVTQAKKTAEFYVPPFPVMLSTDEETTRFASVMADINTLRDEYILGFITGQKNLDEFEDYVAKVESMGIAEAISIKQAQYDRYLEQSAK
ncbi:MAG: extracellular solute-binding protein [Oscillospiraceae bacterium]